MPLGPRPQTLLRLRSPRRLPGVSSGRSDVHSRRAFTLSAVEGPAEPPLDDRTLPDYFQQAVVAKHRSRPALICPREPARPFGGPVSRNMGVAGHLAWDFDEFDRTIGALTRGLLNLGVRKGDRVGVIMGNNRSELAVVVAAAPFS